MENTGITPYAFEGRNVRIIERDDEMWFVATDVARELGYGLAGDLLRLLDDDEKGMHNLHTLGGMQELGIISEPGLYRAIVQRRANKKHDASVTAKINRFQRWVFHDVLPSIRKTGAYEASPSETVESLLASPEKLLTLVQGYAVKVVEQAREIDGMKADVQALDRIANADDLYGLRQTCQILQIEERKFVQWLMTIGWVFRHTGSKTLMGFADKRKAGFMTHKLEVFTKQDGTEGSREVLKFTTTGIVALAKKLHVELPIEFLNGGKRVA